MFVFSSGEKCTTSWMQIFYISFNESIDCLNKQVPSKQTNKPNYKEN
jgi:hypothetical protein